MVGPKWMFWTIKTNVDLSGPFGPNRPKCYVNVAQQKSNSSAKFHFEVYIYTSIFPCDAWLDEDSYIS